MSETEKNDAWKEQEVEKKKRADRFKTKNTKKKSERGKQK